MTSRCVQVLAIVVVTACSGGGGGGGATRDAAGSGSGRARSVAINFDELANDTKVTTQYAPDVTLASKTGELDAFDPGNFGQSQPNFICSDSESCDADYTMTFATGVHGLSFDAIGVNDSDTVATIQLYIGGAAGPSMPLVGKGTEDVPLHVDLTSYTDVTRVDVANITDFGGLGIDDIAFEVPE